MTAPTVTVFACSPDELRELVRTAVVAAVAEIAPAPASTPLVDGKELARTLGVSAATVRRLVADRMPHVFVGQSPRFELARYVRGSTSVGAAGRRRSRARRAGRSPNRFSATACEII